MTTYDILHAANLSDPADRLILADYLAEQGRDAEAERLRRFSFLCLDAGRVVGVPPNELHEDQVAELIQQSVGPKDWARWATAPSDYYLGVYTDGSVVVSPHVGSEMDASQRPVASVRCPGIDRLDMDRYRVEGMTYEESVWDCAKYGDVWDEVNDLCCELLES